MSNHLNEDNTEKVNPLTKRVSGVLVHPTSLPSRYGIGDLGQTAYEFVDFLVAADQQIWQILPIGPIGYGNSPYSSYSALAGNPLLISVDKLREEKLLTEEDTANLPEFPPDEVDFGLVIRTKMPLLEKAYESFKSTNQEAFEAFCTGEAEWLEDYTLFMAVKEDQGGLNWYEWESSIALGDDAVKQEWSKRLQDRIYFHKFLQFQFTQQWLNLRQYANDNGIYLFGDIPIYVAHDSADVWAHKEIFALEEETGLVLEMAGVPPDYFSETGQLWGNPVYNWEKLAATDFQWWVKRFQVMLKYVDLIRLDHFRGFEAFWSVPKGQTTAVKGKWVEAPGDALFTRLQQDLGELPIVAEDLGVITAGVEALRDKFGFPGMKILQFAFDSDRGNSFLPFNYFNRASIVYTGTHDNDTTVGWFSKRSEEEQARVTDFLGCVCTEGIHWSLIRLAMGSIANVAIFPLQDILGLPTEFRMNTPSVAEGNWGWRYQSHCLTADLAQQLKQITYLYGRAKN